MAATDAIPLADIRAARQRIAGAAIRTPLVRLNVADAPAEIYLKLENLQPIGWFKIRGAAKAIALATPEQWARGVYTASAGNMAQGVGWNARRLGIPFTSIVPDHAPEAKLAAITRLGGKIIKVTFDEWWQVVLTRQFPGMSGFFLHPVSDPAVMAGNGTIGLEIIEDLPGVDAVLVPYGGGGLSSGIASAIRALKPGTKVFACEAEGSAPLAPSLAAGSPQSVTYTPSFVDGIGSSSVLPDMWPLVGRLLDGALVSPLAEPAAPLKLLAEGNPVIAEDAGRPSLP